MFAVRLPLSLMVTVIVTSLLTGRVYQETLACVSGCSTLPKLPNDDPHGTILKIFAGKGFIRSDLAIRGFRGQNGYNSLTKPPIGIK